MKTIFYILTAAAALMLAGCAHTEDPYGEEQEYSSMPWNTPQDWEGSRSIPGMSSGN